MTLWLSHLMIKIKPLSDHVVVEPISEKDKTKSGIVLPETAEEESPEQGKVVAVGPGKLLAQGKRKKPEVKPGDKVLFKKYSPTEVELGEKKYLILEENDILAILG